MVEEVLVESNTNMSIGCPGLTRNTFVVQLEWRCVGQCGTPLKKNSPKKKKDKNKKAEHTLLRYVKDQGTTVFKSKDRLRLDTEMFSLAFAPVASEDKGRYSCLINNRPSPDAVIKMNVLGKKRNIAIYLLIVG